MTNNKVASPLRRKAVLVEVKTSAWTARKLDRKITKEVNDQHGASQDAGRYNKLLIEAKHLEEVTRAAGSARELLHTYTKPWSDGVGILPNALHEEFASKFRKIAREFETVVEEFCREYPSYVAERKAKLNGMFNAADYPDPAQIRDKFKLSLRTLPLPDAEDFRADVLDENTIADIKREVEESMATVKRDAFQHSIDQIKDVVGHLATKLKTYGESADGRSKKSYFRDSTVEHVAELAKLLPAFNFDENPEFDKVVARIKRELTVEDAKTLREEPTVRESIAKSADDILKDVEALLG
jgi:hypothetical protein